MKTWGPLLLLVVCCGAERVEYPDGRVNLQKMLVPSEFDNNIKLAADLHAENVHDLNELYLGNRLYNHESAETVDEPNIHSHAREAGDPSRREHLARDRMTDEESAFNDLDQRGFDNTAEWSHPEDEHDDDDSYTECHSAKSDEIENFVGSNLFDGNRKKCFSVDDVALLTARRDFEYLVPKGLPKCLLTDNMVVVLMQYFHCASQVIQRVPEEASKRLCEKAFYDMLGGYLRYYIVPVTKYSFYAGKVSLDTVQKVLALYQECQKLLNTNGNGWRAPIANVLTEMKGVQIEPLQMLSDDMDDQASCMNLDMCSVDNESEDDQMLVSLPKLETEDGEGHLGNIWLPFKRKHIFNLRSMKSAGILVKFYETVTCCYQSRSLSQSSYNKQFRNWILENVQVHLGDEQFYPGLGSVLQIYENLQRGKKAVEFEKVVSKKTIQNDDEEEAEEEDSEDETSDEADEEVAVAKRHNEDYDVSEVRESDVANGDDVWQKLSSEYYNDIGEGDSSKSRKDCIKKPTTPKAVAASTSTVKTTSHTAPPASNKPLTLEEMCQNITAKPKAKTKAKDKEHKKKKKPKKKKKKKPKNKTKSSNKTKHSNKTLKAMFVKLMHNKDSYLLYACYGLGSLVLVILLCVLVLVVGRMVRRRLKSGPPECPPCPPCPEDKEKRSFFDCCKCKKKKKGPPQDEEVIIKSGSSSVLPPPRKSSPKRKQKEQKGKEKEETPRRAEKVQFPTTSSSSVTCQPMKWLPLRRSTKAKRGSSAPTAGEYSSSEVEEPRKPKAKAKKAPPTPPSRDKTPPSPPPKDKSPQKKEKKPPPPPPSKKSPPASPKKNKEDFKSCDCGHKGCKYCSKRTPTKSNESSPASSPRSRFSCKRGKKSDAKSSSDKGSKKNLKNSSSWETVYDT